MDIIWMLALGGMNLLCVLTGARIARKTGRKDRHPHVGAATSRPATADHERRKWASVCHPYDRSTPMGLGAMEGMENIQVAAGRQIAAPTRGNVGFCPVGAVTNGPPVRSFAALGMTEIAKPNPEGLGFSIIVNCPLSIVH